MQENQKQAPNSTDSLDGSERQKRSLFSRIGFTILWFIPVIIVIDMLVGGIVGGFSGSETTTFEAGYASGQKTSQEFFKQYGKMIFVCDLVVWLGLSFFGVLPGTAKYKKKKV